MNERSALAYAIYQASTGKTVLFVATLNRRSLHHEAFEIIENADLDGYTIRSAFGAERIDFDNGGRVIVAREHEAGRGVSADQVMYPSSIQAAAAISLIPCLATTRGDMLAYKEDPS